MYKETYRWRVSNNKIKAKIKIMIQCSTLESAVILDDAI